MSKYLAFMVLVVATVTVAVRELSLLPSGASVDLMEVLAEEYRTREKAANQKQFRLELDATLDYLANGDIRLKSAALRVRHAGEAFCPIFIRLVPRADPGDSLNESVARNLLKHIRTRAERECGLAARVAALESELQEMIVEAGDGESGATRALNDYPLG